MNLQVLAGSRRALLRAMVASLFVVMNAMPAIAQVSALSSIRGAVTDATGGALPGVTVTLTSPALQVGQMVAVTQADGGYRFGELPAGAYRLRFELSGFNTFVRDELRLTVGFEARVDVGMTVGAIQESVTVTGESPIVDLTKTTTASNLTRDQLEELPVPRAAAALRDDARREHDGSARRGRQSDQSSSEHYELWRAVPSEDRSRRDQHRH